MDKLPVWWTPVDQVLCEAYAGWRRDTVPLESFVKACSCRSCACWDSDDGVTGDCLMDEDGDGPALFTTEAINLCEAWMPRPKECR